MCPSFNVFFISNKGQIVCSLFKNCIFAAHCPCKAAGVDYNGTFGGKLLFCKGEASYDFSCVVHQSLLKKNSLDWVYVVLIQLPAVMSDR